MHRNFLTLAAAAGLAHAAVDFNREVRPILSDNCFACHGPDEKQRMADLRLDTREGLFATRQGVAVVTPGSASQSRLYQRITHEKKPMLMPPAATGRTLNARQIAVVRQWIDEGAKWDMHWSYAPPRRPEPPVAKSPVWARNAIDQFVLARLEKEGLRPAAEASRETLIRRLSLDLTGLPPTPAEVDAFAADKTPQAYEKVVDRLLASRHYGERMAMQWLDLARYADTHGYHIDSHRDMWPWRDWVIGAFNNNLPFDKFTLWQIAGDLLPGATREQKLATGFNRNHMINYEGGAIPEEYLVEYVVDRVETTSMVWLGMTMGCARCHDHKYDPISQRDFYRFFAFFNTVNEKGLDGQFGNAAPMLPLPSVQQETELAEVKAALASREERMKKFDLKALVADWERDHVSRLQPARRDGLTAHYEFDGNLADSSGRYAHGKASKGEPSYGLGASGRALDLDGDTQLSLPGAGAFERGKPFSLALWVRSGNGKDGAILERTESAATRRGWELWYDDLEVLLGRKRESNLHFRISHDLASGDTLHIRTRRRMDYGRLNHIAIASDGSGQASGLNLYVDGKPVAFEVLADNWRGTGAAEAPVAIGSKALRRPFKGRLDDVRFYSRALDATDAAALAGGEAIRAIADTPAAKRNREQTDRLRDAYIAQAAPEELRTLDREITQLKARQAELDKQILNAMVMGEMESKPRDTFMLARGDYRNKGDKVTAETPSALPPLPKDAPRNRLGLAQWLLDPNHPLTSRVTVNRFWQHYFGAGLARTSENLGSQGEPPTHPELLDWLASEFVRTGWDVRAMQKLIVMSATYRQSSAAPASLAERDPENRLLARGPRFRLPAELVRDNALASSGLLNAHVGGPSVYPYQPPGLWEELAYGDGFTAQNYVESKGADLYRRSLYTFWKRTSPPAQMAAFDAPDREKCISRRQTTNTPLQALILMNDPTYVESARKLAERTLTEAGKDPAMRLRHAFRLATARRPDARESRLLLDLWKQRIAHFRTDRDAAAKLIAVGDSKAGAQFDAAELAAWTTVASVILNLDETITKE